MIQKWELAHFPFEKDSLRFKARVRGSEEDLKELISKLPVECGRPFITLSQDYDWAFYLYKLDEIARLKAVDVFTGFCADGTLIDSPSLHVEKELPPMLEDMLETAAKNFITPAKSEISKPEPVVQEKVSVSASAAPLSSVQAQETISTPLNPSYSFNSFIVGPNNRFTHAAAQAVAENPGKIYNPFFIYGGVGLGKTHLMQAIGNFILAKNPQLKVIFISTEKFMSMVIEGIRRGNINPLREQFRHLDLLLIDDIQFLSGSESTQEEFFHVFNSLHQIGKQIVITSDRPPKQLSTLEDRLRSRFEWGLITDLKSPNLETRVAILKSKSDQIDLSLTNEQLMYVAEKSKSNIRELEGIVKKIYATASLMNSKVDLSLLKGVMEDDSPEQAHEPAVKEPAIPVPPPAPKSEPASEKKKAPEEEKKKASELEDIMQRLNEAISPPTPFVPEPAPAPVPPPPPPPPPKVPEKEVPPAPVTVSEKILPVAAQAIDENEDFEIATRAVSQKKAEPPAPEPPSPEPVAIRSDPAPSAAADETPDPDDPDVDQTLKSVDVVCFYPSGKIEDYRTLRSKFMLILKKHKLKFRLNRLAEKSFNYEGKLDYTFFSKVCRDKKCSIALVLGPPQTPMLSEDDFAGFLSAALEEERIALQFIPWSEMGKDYRYLNCALDLSLLIPAADSGKTPPKT